MKQFTAYQFGLAW